MATISPITLLCQAEPDGALLRENRSCSCLAKTVAAGKGVRGEPAWSGTPLYAQTLQRERVVSTAQLLVYFVTKAPLVAMGACGPASYLS